MSRYFQMHILATYGPSNPNRDDQGRPKMTTFGGVSRLRLSSQSLKRAWRTSDQFSDVVQAELGTRTRHLAGFVARQLAADGVDAQKAQKIAVEVISNLATASKKNPLISGQLVHYSPAEMDEIRKIAIEAANADGKVPKDTSDRIGSRGAVAIDIAMFGRMMAGTSMAEEEEGEEEPGDKDGKPKKKVKKGKNGKAPMSVDAAVSVAHAVTVNKSAGEEDYFSAVDDLSKELGEEGAGHVDVQEFGWGVYYGHVSVNYDLLIRSLAGDEELANRGLRALALAVAQVGPQAKKNSYGRQGEAYYIRADWSIRQPQSAIEAFLNPISGQDIDKEAVRRLENHAAERDRRYGVESEKVFVLNSIDAQGTYSELSEFARAIL